MPSYGKLVPRKCLNPSGNHYYATPLVCGGARHSPSVGSSNARYIVHTPYCFSPCMVWVATGRYPSILGFCGIWDGTNGLEIICPRAASFFELGVPIALSL